MNFFISLLGVVEEPVRSDLAVGDLIHGDLIQHHAADAFHGHLHFLRHGEVVVRNNGISRSSWVGPLFFWDCL